MRLFASGPARPLFVPLLVLMLCSCATLETPRNVYVNGERQNALGVALLDQKAGRPLPDGRYWYNPVTGEFGVAGRKTALGNLHVGAGSAPVAPRSRTSGASGGSVSQSANGTAGSGRDAEGRNCAFVSIPNGAGMMTCN